MFQPVSRRQFLRRCAAGAVGAAAWSLRNPFSSDGFARAQSGSAHLYYLYNIPVPGGGLEHEGVELLVKLIGLHGLKFYKSAATTLTSGPGGLIAADDVVIVKVNAQWKYRGASNSDVVKGLIQKVLLHPDGFTGEVIVFENGQGYGSLDCDSMGRGGGGSPYPPGDTGVHANAEDELHSFSYLVDSVFADPRVTKILMDPYINTFISADDHSTNGFRKQGSISYPCFVSGGGRRVEWKEGIWDGGGYQQKLKVLNVPVLKHHDGTGITAALKHMFGVLSMNDGGMAGRHYAGAGADCGTMFSPLVRAPVLNILDCIWVTQQGWSGYPEAYTTRKNTLIAAVDAVALDYWASKYILYPIDWNGYHNPDAAGDLRTFLTQARDTANMYGGIGGQPATMNESQIRVYGHDATSEPTDVVVKGLGGSAVARLGGDGGVVLAGTLYESASSGELAATAETEFVVKGSGGEVIARIDGSTGDMYLKGTASTGLPSISPGSEPEFLVKDFWGDAAVAIDSAGNLYALGAVTENGSP